MFHKGDQEVQHKRMERRQVYIIWRKKNLSLCACAYRTDVLQYYFKSFQNSFMINTVVTVVVSYKKV